MLDRLNGELNAELSDRPVNGDRLPLADEPGRLDSCSVDEKFFIFFFFLDNGFAEEPVTPPSSSSSRASHLLFGFRILLAWLPAGDGAAEEHARSYRRDAEVLAMPSITPCLAREQELCDGGAGQRKGRARWCLLSSGQHQRNKAIHVLPHEILAEHIYLAVSMPTQRSCSWALN